MNCTRTLGPLLTILLIAACSDPAGPPVGVADADFARPPSAGGGGGVDADSSLTFQFPDSGYGLSSDGSAYEDGVCGVSATLYDTSGDAVLSTDNPGGGARQCADFPRRLAFDYDGDGSADETVAMRVNVFGVGGLKPGASALGPMNVGLAGSSTCESLRFRSVLRDGTTTGADDVTVTRHADGSWTVTNAAEGRAACFNGGVQTGTFQIRVFFTIRATGPER